MRYFQKLLALAILLVLSARGVVRGQDFPITGVQMVDIPGMVLPDVLHGGSLPDGRSPDYKAKMAALNGKAATGAVFRLVYSVRSGVRPHPRPLSGGEGSQPSLNAPLSESEGNGQYYWQDVYVERTPLHRRGAGGEA